MSTPPPLPQRRSVSNAPASAPAPETVASGGQPVTLSNGEDVQPPVADAGTFPAALPTDESFKPPPLPQRRQAVPIIMTTTASTGNLIGASSTAENIIQPTVAITPQLVTASPPALSPPRQSTKSTSSLSIQEQQERLANGPTLAAMTVTPQTKAQASFQFDRHVQEIRRRKVAHKRPPPPVKEDYVRIEAESGKKILDVPMYLQARFSYVIESLARDPVDRTKVEPLQWSKIKRMLSRLYDTSNPAQSFGSHVEAVAYWKNPTESLLWFTLYFSLWCYNLWLPGCFLFAALVILNNRYRFYPKSAKPGGATNPTTPESRAGKIHSQLRELIHSKNLTDWISQTTKIWGPYMQALMEENINYLERFKNLIRWEYPLQTWRVLGLLSFYIFVSTFLPHLVVPAVGLFCGTEFFILLALQKNYPRFSHCFSPVEWILWGVPTNADLAVEMLLKQDEEGRRQEYEASLAEAAVASGSVMNDAGSFANGGSAVGGSSGAGLTPASKIKFEYLNRTDDGAMAANAFGGPSSSGASTHTAGSNTPTMMSNSSGWQGHQNKSEFHCLLRGKPGKLVITEDSLQFRSNKLLGRDIEASIPWTNIDAIRKQKTLNFGIWSLPGIEIVDVDGNLIVFQNVVHRDDAFRKLVLTSGQKWSDMQ